MANSLPSSDSGFASYPWSEWKDAASVVSVTVTEIPDYVDLVTASTGPAIAPNGFGWLFFRFRKNSTFSYSPPILVTVSQFVVPFPKPLEEQAIAIFVPRLGVEGALSYETIGSYDTVPKPEP